MDSITSSEEIAVSCIVCHHKGILIEKAVQTLLNTKGVRFEIIVVSCILKTDFYGVRVIHHPGQPAEKRNLGVRYAKYPYIAFFDDDVEVRDNTVLEMVKVLRRDDVGMVFGKLLNYEDNNYFDEAGGFMTWTGFIWARGDRTKDTGQFETDEPIFAGKSAACMIRRSLINLLSGFDISFGILGEESDLAWRVWRSGKTVFYAPKSVTYHKFNTRFKPMDHYSIDRVYYNGCRNYLSMLLKNAPIALLCVALPLQFLAWSLTALSQLFSGKAHHAFAILKGMVYFVRHMPHLIKNRHAFRMQTLDSLKSLIRNPPVSYYFNRLKNYLKSGLHG